MTQSTTTGKMGAIGQAFFSESEPVFEEGASIIDLRQSTNHPLSFLYTEIYKNALITGKVVDGRLPPGYSLASGSHFVVAAAKAVQYGIERDDVVDVIEEVLSEYYRAVRPASAAEWLGLDLSDNNKLTQSPPWASVFPWRARTLESYRRAYEDAAVKENRAVGAQLDISEGWLFCGPVSREKTRLEARRLEYAIKQIASHGYKRSDQSEGDVRATALVDDSDKWRWLITAGTHRASAASALGFQEIPIRVNLVISRTHVKYWPHVVSGLYNEENALKVFDNYFKGVVPPVLRQWLSRSNMA